MVVLLISILVAPINIHAQQQEEYRLYAKQRADITFSLSVSGSQSGSMSMSMSFQYEYNITITGSSVRGKIRVECLEASADYSYGSTRTSTRVPSNECNKLLGDLAQRGIELYGSIEDLYERRFRESLRQLEDLMQYIQLPFSLSINIDFNGFQTYKGYKVAVFSFGLNMKYEYLGAAFEMRGGGKEYVYVGFPITLYAEGKFDIDVKSSEGSGSGSIQVKLETLEADLPMKTPYGYVKHDKYTILAAGLPGSKIVVNGDKGSEKLTIRNEGNAAGYVAIIYSSNSSSLKLEAYNYISSSDQQKMYVYALKPGEERVITLPFVLSDSVKIVTSYTSGFDASSILILIIIIAAVSIPIYLILRPRRKPDIAQAPITEQPPSTI